MIRVLVRVTAVLWLVHGTATAAAAQAEDPAVIVARTEAVAAEVQAQVTCVQARQSSLRSVLGLMREAMTQRRDAGTDEIRRAAEQTVVALQQRVGRILHELAQCRPPAPSASGLTVDEHGDPIVYRDAPRDHVAEAVAQANDPTRRVSEELRLGADVRVTRGEQVDGHGRVDPAELRSAMSAIGGRVQECYGQLVDRRAAETGSAVLTFRVGSDGRVSRVAASQLTLGDAAFARCLERAAAAIRASSARGGDAELSYSLSFGRAP